MHRLQRIGIIAMALLVLAGVLSPLTSHANTATVAVALEAASVEIPAATTGISRFTGEFAIHTYSAYAEYIRASRNIAQSISEFTITADNLAEKAPSSYVEYDFMGIDGPVLITGEYGTNTWEFYVSQSGLYMLELEYFPLPGRGNNIEKSLYINGVQPFRELAGISFQRRWQSAGPILQDRMGNDIQPGLIEVPGWYTQGIKDFRGYYTDPFRIYLEAGVNTLSLVSVRDSMAISQIRFFYQEPAISYAEYLAVHGGVAASSDVLFMFQAQYADMTSASTLVPAVDRSSAATVPSSPSTHRLNSINGNNWRFPRQWLSWDAYVEEAGLYHISMRWKQDEISGFSSARKILINGELPFAEASEIIFPFTTRWQLTTVSDDSGAPFLFYLNQGHNTIQIEATTGQMAHIVARVDESLVTLNAIYRQIVQITGVIPDPGRDFNLERYIPDALEELANQGQILEQILEDLNAHGGGGGQSSASIQRLIVQIDQMTRRPDRLHRRVTDFQSDLSGLADWLVWALVQPLTLDYVVVSSPDAELPRANSRFFASLWFHFRMFLASFRDNNTYLGDETGTETITVWIGGGMLGGRDQAQVLRRLIDNHFTPRYGINVNLQLVQMGSLLPATFAGQNPDVAIQLGTAEIINYGLRGALLDLTQFDNFDDIADRFTPQTWIPYVFADSVYGVLRL